MKVGFIGLGRMGAGMAAHLIKAGHEVTVYNRTPIKAGALVTQGAKRADSIAAACRGEAVVTMLADDEALQQTVLGSGGVLESLAAGALHVSSSTISVAMSARLTERHAGAGQLFVAAPVFGRPEAAAAGKLFVVAAGAPQALGAAGPLLAAVGQRTFIVSQIPKLANLVKLSGNFLIASVIESLGEALALIDKGGVDPAPYLEFLTSTLFNVPIYQTYGPLIAGGKFEPAGFAARLGHKDIRLTLQAAEELRVPLPFAGVLGDRFLTLLARGGGGLDWSAIGKLAAADAALTGIGRD